MTPHSQSPKTISYRAGFQMVRRSLEYQLRLQDICFRRRVSTSRLAASFEYLDSTLMDDLEATFASFFRASSSSSGFSIIVEIGANIGNLFNYFALIYSCSGWRDHCPKGDKGNRLDSKIKTSLRRIDQAAGAGLTSILSLTATPGFVLFANSIAFFLAAWVRTVPDNVTSFLTASPFTLRSADFNCGSFSSFARTAFSKSESLIDAFKR